MSSESQAQVGNIDPLPLTVKEEPTEASTTASQKLTGDIGSEEKPWHAAFPKPSVEADYLPSEQVLEELKDEEKKKGVLLVDLRRNDHDGKTIGDALNLPAQSLYTSIPTVVDLAIAANKPKIIYYCGQSLGRGSRAAAWTKEYIEKKGLGDKVSSFALEGGIKGWVKNADEKPDFKAFLGETDKAEGW
ncbi:hypothetical protein BJ508DRAFT_419395 [Ascobolus immersus RN42]|uniref:Rhodanese domain-containing protein n=1 Tax=Ascobolus immersus RN42 TaxID=1160509 RepID=A0A3N4HGE8_ASCIM|nr:hypothetical protein BJ508DRAFT_419395 [Ascobolus immersus RN42]